MASSADKKENSRIEPRNITIYRPAQALSLTRFTGAPGTRLTKQFHKDEKDLIRKESQPQFSNGEAELLKLEKLSDVEDIVESLRSDQCLSTGVFDVPVCRITTKDRYAPDEQDPPLRTRSKEHMHQPDSGLMLLDYDPDPHMPEHLKCDTPEELMTKLVEAVPEFDGVGHSAVGSNSNGIFDEETGEPYPGGGGMHVYVAVDGVDNNQLRQYLKVKLWNAGFGYISFARNGAMLERTLIDLSVLSPERLIYEASPVLGEGVGRKPREWAHADGKVLKEIAVPTDEEIAQHERLVSDARDNDDAVTKSGQLQSRHRDTQIEQLVQEKHVSRDEAERRIPKRSSADLAKTTQTLCLDETVEMAGRKMLVSELVERGEEFHGKAMPDPIEGGEYGTTTAMYYHNDGVKPRIHSFAHGVKAVYAIAVPQQDIDAFKRTTTEVIDAKPTGLSEPLDAEIFPHTVSKKDGSHKPKCTIENVEHLIKGYGITVQYDVIAKETNILIPGASGITENSANTAIESINSLASLNNMPIGQVPRYVAVIADRNAVNPIADWITCREWDGEDRIPALCDTLQARVDYPDEFKCILVEKWLLSAVAAATSSSGFHSRGILTLQGAQGLGKTSWIRRLMPDGLLRDKSILTGHHLDPANKDSLTTAIRHWIVEIGELDSSFKKDVARLKGFITQDKDKVRRPYARTDSEYARRTVFCASVNEENFLIDQTGNSRFWTLPLVKIDYEHEIDMQQVFAQMHEKLRRGAQWWLTPDEDRCLDKLNQAHKSVSVIEERVRSALQPELPDEKWKNMSATEVLQAAGYGSPTNPQARECGAVLRRLYDDPKKIQGIMKWRVPIASDFTRVQ